MMITYKGILIDFGETFLYAVVAPHQKKFTRKKNVQNAVKFYKIYQAKRYKDIVILNHCGENVTDEVFRCYMIQAIGQLSMGNGKYSENLFPAG